MPADWVEFPTPGDYAEVWGTGQLADRLLTASSQVGGYRFSDGSGGEYNADPVLRRAAWPIVLVARQYPLKSYVPGAPHCPDQSKQLIGQRCGHSFG